MTLYDLITGAQDVWCEIFGDARSWMVKTTRFRSGMARTRRGQDSRLAAADGWGVVDEEEWDNNKEEEEGWEGRRSRRRRRRTRRRREGGDELDEKGGRIAMGSGRTGRGRGRRRGVRRVSLARPCTKPGVHGMRAIRALEGGFIPSGGHSGLRCPPQWWHLRPRASARARTCARYPRERKKWIRRVRRVGGRGLGCSMVEGMLRGMWELGRRGEEDNGHDGKGGEDDDEDQRGEATEELGGQRGST